jgi:hypothetical protein
MKENSVPCFFERPQLGNNAKQINDLHRKLKEGQGALADLPYSYESPDSGFDLAHKISPTSVNSKLRSA